MSNIDYAAFESRATDLEEFWGAIGGVNQRQKEGCYPCFYRQFYILFLNHGRVKLGV
jgi:hypothetical protein